MTIIAHMDFDAFFASVEEQEHPWLKGSPVVVGNDPKSGKGRGVVATANYAARKYGIHSAMPIQQAWKLHQEAVLRGELPVYFVSGSMRRYSSYSRRIMQLAKEVVDQMDIVGIDEAYLDCSSCGTFARAKAMLTDLQERIEEETGISVSFGIAANKLLAKIASDMKKPRGITVIAEGGEQDVLAGLSISRIPGIGPKTATTLRKFGISSVRELQRLRKEELVDLFGKWGGVLYEKARGKGSVQFGTRGPKKTISTERTFGRDKKKLNELLEALHILSAELCRRVRKAGFSQMGQVAVIVRFSNFETHTKQKTLQKPVDNPKAVYQAILPLFLPFTDKRMNKSHQAIRLLGVRAGKLEVVKDIKDRDDS